MCGQSERNLVALKLRAPQFVFLFQCPSNGDQRYEMASDFRANRGRKGTSTEQREISGPKSEPVLRTICPSKSTKVSGVRIHTSPPTSLYCLPTIWRWRKRGAHARRFCASKRTREELVRADQPNCAGVFSARRKAGSLQDSGRHWPIHRLLWNLVGAFNRSQAPSAAPAIGAADRSDSARSRCLVRQAVVPPRLPQRW